MKRSSAKLDSSKGDKMEPFVIYALVNAGLQVVRSVSDTYTQRNRNKIQEQQNELLRKDKKEEFELLRQDKREELLLQLRNQRERDAENYARSLENASFMRTLNNSWPLTIGPQEYLHLFDPKASDNIVPFGILIDNRVHDKNSYLLKSLWSELDDLLGEVFCGIRQYCFNSSGMTKVTSGDGLDIELLHKYSAHIPTLVISPNMDNIHTIRIRFIIWGDGIQKYKKYIDIPVNKIKISVAREVTEQYFQLYNKSDVGNTEISTILYEKYLRYKHIFDLEAEELKKGELSIDELIKLGRYDEILCFPEKPDEIDNLIYGRLASVLAHSLLLPVGSIIDSYYVDGYGFEPKFPDIVKKVNLPEHNGKDVLKEYCEALLLGIKNGTSLLGYHQIENFIEELTSSGYSDLCGELINVLKFSKKTDSIPSHISKQIPPPHQNNLTKTKIEKKSNNSFVNL